MLLNTYIDNTEQKVALNTSYSYTADTTTTFSSNYTVLQAVLDEIEKATTIEHPDPTNPDAKKEPIPIFIDMSDCEKLTELYTHEMDRLLLGIFSNPSN